MSIQGLRNGVVCFLLAALSCGMVLAQMTVTGSITGTVTDPSGQMVPLAKVSLTSTTTGDVRTTNTNEVGTFSLIAVQPDTYSLRIEHSGFKTYTRTGVVLSANEHLSAGDIAL